MPHFMQFFLHKFPKSRSHDPEICLVVLKVKFYEININNFAIVELQCKQGLLNSKTTEIPKHFL